jgi:hypothetical protein
MARVNPAGTKLDWRQPPHLLQTHPEHQTRPVEERSMGIRETNTPTYRIRRTQKVKGNPGSIGADVLRTRVDSRVKQREKSMFNKFPCGNAHGESIFGRNSKLEVIKQMDVLQETRLLRQDLAKMGTLPPGVGCSASASERYFRIRTPRY